MGWCKIYKKIEVKIDDYNLKQYTRVNNKKAKEIVKIIKGVIKEFLDYF